MQIKAPVMFVSHGAPTYALSPGKAGESLQQAHPYFTGVKAVLLLSAHWITDGQEIMSTEQPATLYDFGGFPDALYQLSYPAPGNPVLAREVQQTLSQTGIDSTLNAQRGFDHGAWVPMMHLLPEAQIPIVEISINRRLSHRQLYELGQALAPLRSKGIAIIGSGSLTHNLRDVAWRQTDPLPYVLRFQDDVKRALETRDYDRLIDHAEHIGDFHQAHPSDDHYLPLVFALGTVGPTDRLEVLEGGIDYRALSMDSYLWH